MIVDKKIGEHVHGELPGLCQICELRRTIDRLTQTLATERDKFGKREIELMQENRDLREALEIISKGKSDGLDHSVDIARLERAIKIAKAALAKSGDRHE